ncbi:hypothetical protein M0812_19236 [Anaeramoeba flamelloides]|uniref:Galectin n=1 Tax=Anaeramoeba flamelloides TaxID=1746091 RepID=A0AAV7ZAI5_9EUKA|nr:hypothetical protein M0812_19236 [Anaeramoeba flamelloides]
MWKNKGSYYFKTWWSDYKLKCTKRKKDIGKTITKIYPKNIKLEEDDIFEISLDMDLRKISFKINEKNLGGWDNLPEKINFFAFLSDQYGEEKNKITLI